MAGRGRRHRRDRPADRRGRDREERRRGAVAVRRHGHASCTAPRATCCWSARRSSRWTRAPAPTRRATESRDAAKDAYRAEERAGSGNVLIGYGTAEAKGSGRTRRPRGAAVTAPANARRDASPAATATGPLAVRSPIVRRLAQERGVDLHAVTPTGPEGIITRADVLGATGATPKRAAGAVGTAAPRHPVPSSAPSRSACCARPSPPRCRAAGPRSPRRPSGWMSTRPTSGTCAGRWPPTTRCRDRCRRSPR